MKEVLRPLSLIIKKLQSFKHLTQHLDDLLNIDNLYFEGKPGGMNFPPELQLN